MFAAVGVLSLLVPSSAIAQAPATVSGNITDANTGNPIVGEVPSFVVVYDSAGRSVGDAETDAAGHYEIQIPNVVAGSYFVRVNFAPGYITELHQDIVCVAEDCPVTGGTPVPLQPGTAVTINFALARGGTITGVVRRASDGAGLANYGVFVYNASTSGVTTVATDESGAYSVTGLPSGTYFAQAASFALEADPMSELFGGVQCPPSTECRIASGTPISVTAGATTSGIDFSLDAPSSISGTVAAAATAAPLTSVVTTAYLADVEVASARTNSSGQYTITGLAPGVYRVRTSLIPYTPTLNYVDAWYGDVCVGCTGTPTAVNVPASTNVTGIDFSLATGGQITGTFNCEIGPQDSVAVPTIYAYSASGTFVRWATFGPQLRPPSPVGSRFDCTTHDFAIAGLPTGRFYLLARDRPAGRASLSPTGGSLIDELYNDIVCVTADCDVTKGTPVQVTAGAVTGGIDISLAIGATLSAPVEVVDPLAPEPPLSIFDARGVPLVSTVLQGPGPSDSFVGLPPGTYYVKAGDTLYSGIVCKDCPPTSGTPIVVPATSAITPTFPSPANRRVSGIVRDASSLLPLSTITVELVNGTAHVVGTGLSTMFGTYSIDGLEPGTYFARTRNDRGYVDELYSERTCGTCDPRAGTPITVASTNVPGIDFTLAAGGLVAGATGDASGFPVGNVPVSLFNAGGTLVDRTISSAKGRYSFNVPAGSYRARAEATQTHGAELYSETPCTSAACNIASGTPINVVTGATVAGIDFTLPSCSAMKISPASLAAGVVGRSYRQLIGVTGGVGPFAIDVADGALPSGVTLDRASGVLAGVPADSARYEFRISAMDAAGCSTANTYTLDVQGCAFALNPSSAPVPASGGTVNVSISDACGSQNVTEATFVHVQSNTNGQVTLLVDPNSTNAARSASVTIGRRIFTVRQAGSASLAPFGWVDVPFDGQQVSGSIAVSGWALDDLEVRRVVIYRDAVSPEAPGLVFVGTAVFIAGARPDVQRGYAAYPLNGRAGWGFLILTNTLPNQGNGPFRIHVYAEDVEGHTTLLGSRQIIGVNATSVLPFGTIDTPGQGETISGSEYLNWGWALTPQPAAIPFDGSTISVIVDGALVGNVTYNLFRPDVSTLFPGLANSNGPVGYRLMDTTGLAEGLHTISWVINDDHGRTSGVGSRFFTVANSADAAQPQASVTSAVTGQQAMAAIDDAVREEVARPLGVPSAPDSERQLASLEAVPVSEGPIAAQRDAGPTRHVRARANGTRALTLSAMERLELTLQERDDDTSCPGTWAGYLITSGILSNLPVGASLDPVGVFYWQSGPGFAGQFDLLFVRTDCHGEKQRVPVTIMIRPR